MAFYTLFCSKSAKIKKINLFQDHHKYTTNVISNSDIITAAYKRVETTGLLTNA